MQAEVLIDERTGQRFKASPTTGAKYYLTPLDKEAPRKESNVAEKLARLRMKMSHLEKEYKKAHSSLKLEEARCRILKRALVVRRTYTECPDCGLRIEAGDSHAFHCQHHKGESLVLP